MHIRDEKSPLSLPEREQSALILYTEVDVDLADDEIGIPDVICVIEKYRDGQTTYDISFLK